MTNRYFKTLFASATSALLLASLIPPAIAAGYKIDPAHSFIQFRTKHLGYSWLVGKFNRFEGTMNYDPSAGPEAQNISVTIDASSLDTNHAERDKHHDRCQRPSGEHADAWQQRWHQHGSSKCPRHCPDSDLYRRGDPTTRRACIDGAL